jgi:hypothetical protein
VLRWQQRLHAIVSEDYDDGDAVVDHAFAIANRNLGNIPDEPTDRAQRAQLHSEPLSVFRPSTLADLLEIRSRERPVTCELLVGWVDG